MSFLVICHECGALSLLPPSSRSSLIKEVLGYNMRALSLYASLQILHAMARVREKNPAYPYAQKVENELLGEDKAAVFLHGFPQRSEPSFSSTPPTSAVHRVVMVHPRHLPKFHFCSPLSPEVTRNHLHLIMDLDVPFTSLEQSIFMLCRPLSERGPAAEEEVMEDVLVNERGPDAEDEMREDVLVSPQWEEEEEEEVVVLESHGGDHGHASDMTAAAAATMPMSGGGAAAPLAPPSPPHQPFRWIVVPPTPVRSRPLPSHAGDIAGEEGSDFEVVDD